jgi:putative membrane protein
VSDTSDPRVFFAAERTLLAWIRTGIAVMGLGFVVARFGVFLRVVSQRPEMPTSHVSAIIGVAFILLGSLSIALAAWQHLCFCKTLTPLEMPRSYRATWSLWFAVLLSLAGLILGIYLTTSLEGP